MTGYLYIVKRKKKHKFLRGSIKGNEWVSVSNEKGISTLQFFYKRYGVCCCRFAIWVLNYLGPTRFNFDSL